MKVVNFKYTIKLSCIILIKFQRPVFSPEIPEVNYAYLENISLSLIVLFVNIVIKREFALFQFFLQAISNKIISLHSLLHTLNLSVDVREGYWFK